MDNNEVLASLHAKLLIYEKKLKEDSVYKNDKRKSLMVLRDAVATEIYELSLLVEVAKKNSQGFDSITNVRDLYMRLQNSAKLPCYLFEREDEDSRYQTHNYSNLNEWWWKLTFIFFFFIT